jgi:hypothetical protein
MLWTGVPKAAVDEQHEAIPREHEIGIPEHPCTATPACDAVTAEQRHHRDFGGFVAPASHTGHDV